MKQESSKFCEAKNPVSIKDFYLQIDTYSSWLLIWRLAVAS